MKATIIGNNFKAEIEGTEFELGYLIGSIADRNSAKEGKVDLSPDPPELLIPPEDIKEIEKPKAVPRKTKKAKAENLTRRPWSDEDDRILLGEKAKRTKDADIAIMLGRGVSAIANRAFLLRKSGVKKDKPGVLGDYSFEGEKEKFQIAAKAMDEAGLCKKFGISVRECKARLIDIQNGN